ncbi:MAG: hypothetical protein K9L62_10800 [Vallitaleaceae bacterium]|nr:hypothetical protein [Vallitaleaceae bacterium]
MIVYVNGQQMNLSQRDYVAKGGEGSIYRKGDIAFKIYEDLNKMIPVAKIGELSQLNHDSIVRPQNVVYDEKKHEVGFTMNWLGGNIVALCKLFTNTFRKNNNIENDQIIELVENIKNVTQFIHERKFLIVDNNELNYMVSEDFVNPYLIDVNAWKTPSYPPTAIMPSIRDWTTDNFTPLSDWFSFAIISFQLFVGIHPYKGKHKKYRKNDFRKRVIDCISVFNSEVALPPTTRDFNLIPSAYKDWYYQVFENGARKPPPPIPGMAGVAQVLVQIIKSTDNFDIRELVKFKEEILFHNATLGLTKTKERIYIGKTEYKVDVNVEVIFTPLENAPMLVKIENKRIRFKAFSGNNPSIDLECTDMMIINNTLFLKNKERLMELTFKQFNDKIHPIIKTTWSIEPNSSQMFSGVVVQSVLGKTYLAIPLPSFDKSSFMIKAIPELNEYRIMDAKYENKICVLTGYKGGVYSRFIIIFDDKHTKYTLRQVNDVDYATINFTCLDNGVCVLITDDDAIEIFLNRIDKDAVKRIEDPIINSTMRLCKEGNQVRFFRNNKVYEIKMR